MRELRPDVSADDFLSVVRAQYVEGYRIAALTDDAGRLASVAGFRIVHTLAGGKTLYVDDLVTAEERRGSGFGGALLEWLRQYAKERRCALIALDSGVHRSRAHTFYFSERFVITDFHFECKL